MQKRELKNIGTVRANEIQLICWESHRVNGGFSAYY